ncbi:rhamnogalacturonan acetylesterase [Pelagicoccus sp. NFK12]|uniref:Rhamnogalacturonan acetylesterase n=1 Tax=Pelagicoccus enzymogenes TaxID=2773457 RepID=A0A927F8J1_9BACT|nr:rhamnogalacturonan acetylesterase [Pelagicoccus enzymogenes]MBD5779135.1 rhamnogalacturonan acetylesterase [Pelagicoccus enzymogenes]MDQ8201038.1 rhamnogalacturonan acetylesterase [Pelagicoccus enzymogenes]
MTSPLHLLASHCLIALSLTTLQFSSAAPNATSPEQAEHHIPRLFIASDSTAAQTNKRPQYGWGEFLGEHFDPDRLEVVNLAKGGRSSRTFISEGWWAELLEQSKPRDWVIIQFGHNDATAIGASMFRGSLPGLGNESETLLNTKTGERETVRSFGSYLREMLRDAKAAKLHPILVSPTVRKSWQEGKIVRDAEGHGEWTRQIALQENVPYIDLNSRVTDILDALGPEKVETMYQGKTHFRAPGAQLHAATLALELANHLDIPIKQ